NPRVDSPGRGRTLSRLSAVIACAVLAAMTGSPVRAATIATDLGTLPGGNFSEAYGINAVGQVAGFSTKAGGAVHAVLWTVATSAALRGRAIDLGTQPGGSFSQAFGINAVGQVIGRA